MKIKFIIKWFCLLVCILGITPNIRVFAEVVDILANKVIKYYDDDKLLELRGAVLDDDEELVAKILDENPELLNAVVKLWSLEYKNEEITGLPVDDAVRGDYTLLNIASLSDEVSIETMKLLLDRGAVIDISDESCENYNPFGLSSLITAVQSGNAKKVKMLLDYGANLFTRDEFGRTPLHTAIKDADLNMVKTIVEYVKKKDKNLLPSVINAPDKQNVTPIAYGVNKPDGYLIIKYLLDNGANPNMKENIQGASLLHFFVSERKLRLIILLTNYGVDMAAKDNKGRTALDYAKSLGYTEIINFLKKFPVK